MQYLGKQVGFVTYLLTLVGSQEVSSPRSFNSKNLQTVCPDKDTIKKPKNNCNTSSVSSENDTAVITLKTHVQLLNSKLFIIQISPTNKEQASPYGNSVTKNKSELRVVCKSTTDSKTDCE
jgi:hypothetical protein